MMRPSPNECAAVSEAVSQMSKTGRQRTGVRFVLENCLDPARIDEYNDWYDTFAAECTKPGLLVNALRFDNPDAAGTVEDPGFLAIYDIVTPDPGTAWPPTAEHLKPLYPTFPDYSSVVLAGTYSLVSSVEGTGDEQTPTGATIVMTDDAEASTLERFAGTLVESGLFTTASCFTLVEGFPDVPPKQLLVLETSDADPLSALTRAEEATETASSAVRHAGSFRLYSSYP